VPGYTAGLDRGIKGLRIGLPENYFYDPVEPEVAALVRASLEVFEALGAELVPVALPASVEASNALSMMLISIEGASFHARWLRERREDYGAQTLGRLLPGLLYPATRYIEALKLRGKLLDDLRASVFDRVDVIHTPMWPFPIPTIAGSDVAANPGFLEFLADTGHCARPVNFAGLPAVVVPAGCTENGLPTAFQLIGRPFDEGLLLAAAAAYERETGCTAQAPPL
jgi:aspartyl-tRNA(Asn)/glutamyl-tRNA(Gln) amidotransferase subunit A